MPLLDRPGPVSDMIVTGSCGYCMFDSVLQAKCLRFTQCLVRRSHVYILSYKCFAAESSVLLKQRPGEVLQCFVAASSVFILAEHPDEVLLCFVAASTPPRRTSWGCSPMFHSGISVFSLAERPDEVLLCFVAASTPPRRTSWGCSPMFHSCISVLSLAERPDEDLQYFIAASNVFIRAERPEEVLQGFIQASVYSPWQNVLMKITIVSLQQVYSPSRMS